MLAADGAPVRQGALRNALMMDVSLWGTCGDSCFQAHMPPPPSPTRSLLVKMIHMQTVLTLLWRTNAFLGTFVIAGPRVVHQSPFACLYHQTLSALFTGAFNTCWRQSIQTEIHSFGVTVSLKDECAPEEDDNRMPTLCFFFFLLKEKELLSERRWVAPPASQYVCAFLHRRSKMWLQRCREKTRAEAGRSGNKTVFEGV